MVMLDSTNNGNPSFLAGGKASLKENVWLCITPRTRRGGEIRIGLEEVNTASGKGKE